jgi:predicted ATPase/class 3 adenylate cyclase
MSELPTGTLTFVFTDVEGSTSMVQRLGEGFVSVLESHQQLMRRAFRSGIEVNSEGDGFFYVFRSAGDAVRAACSAQRDLAAFDWPEGGTVLVRIGAHTGEAVLGGDDYAGLDVNRAARIAAAGHGGQILLSAATRILAMSALDEDATLVDLGDHRLRGLAEPEHIYQVVVRGLPSDFPPIATQDTVPNNLPAQPTAFVGRERESREVREHLRRHRLVTLTGPSGSGKTRLAIHVASRAHTEYPDGVFYVPLESLRGAELVAAAIAEHLGIADDDAGSPITAVIDRFRSKSLLLLVDNFEHVLAASEDIATLLAGIPGLDVLATSQRPLRVRAEFAYAVPPMAATEAVELFADLASPDVSLASEDQRLVVEEIVDLLEGVPLALELTAPRVKLFGLTGLRDRLLARLEVPAADLADLPERHRSLDNAISWSYDLLDAADQELLRRLAVFDGGFTLDAAEAIAPTPNATAAGVAELLDRSLLRNRVNRGEVRFSMLESVRLFALGALVDAGDDDDAVSRHAEYFVSLAEAACPKLETDDQRVWLDRLTDEHDNLRAVLRLSRDTEEPDLGLRTAGSIWRFYHRRGHLPEGRRWLELLLSMPGSSPEARVVGMEGLAGISYWQADYAAARELYRALLPLYQELGDDVRVADTLLAIATSSLWLGDVATGRDLAAQARAAYAEAGSRHGPARVTAALAWSVLRSGGPLEESLELWTRAREELAAIGDEGDVRQTTAAVATILHRLGRTREAIDEIRNCLAANIDAGDASGTVMALDFLAAASAATHPEAAVHLAAAVDALQTQAGGGLSAESLDWEPVREQVAATMDVAAIDAAWNAGAGYSLEEAMALGRKIAGLD